MFEDLVLNKFQFGFKKGWGTKEAVGLDEDAVGVAGIFYDLTKAFDLVDRRVIIHMLRGLYE